MKLSVLIIALTVITHCANTKEKEGITQQQKKPEETNYSKNNRQDNIMVFVKKNEPRENAFSILVPKGWRIEGGIFRVNPITQGGPAQSIAAKIDFTVKKDKKGSVMIRWLPDMLYFDTRNTPAGRMGMFPEGSNYQGMAVLYIKSAGNFITEIAFPYAHPKARNIKIIARKKLIDVTNNYSKRVKQVMPVTTMSYDAALVKFKYDENGNQYEESMVSIIENWGQLGAGMWGNKETFLIRTPIDQFEKYAPLFSVIQNSVKINLRWLIGEVKGQATRGQIAVNTQREIQRIGKEIAEHRRKINAEINNDIFLTLMEQEEYINPYTNEIEIGTNQWQHRWINESGDVIYTNSEEYNPNTDINLDKSGYKRSKIRKRVPN
ncbi:hypothetical protein BMS3Abin04_01915 [bacterium BMS3Abin04]|nr:hypothetical protein BMS3Abin04_01915 [bacterium BMS3Abin04]